MIRRFTLIGQDGSTLWNVAPRMPGRGEEKTWQTKQDEPFGLHVFADGTYRVTNGVLVAKTGTVYIARMEFEFDFSPVILPRAGWSVDGNVLTIGTGQECIAPRASMRIREAHNYDRLPRTSSVVIGGKTFALPTSMRGSNDHLVSRIVAQLASGLADGYGPGFWSPALGMWHPLMNPIPNDGGGWNIEPVSGWNQGGETLLHDLTMERQATDCLDPATGEPVVNPPIDQQYRLSRGWSKVTQLPGFCHFTGGSNADLRVPNRWNVGTCPYDSLIHGYYVNSTPGFLPHDGQHLVRAYHNGRAAVNLYDDLCAKFDLEMMAQDAMYTWSTFAIPLKHSNGSPSLGRRECAEVIDLCNYSQLAAACALAQMPNGGVMRCAHKDASGVVIPWGFIPDPWTEQTENGIVWPPLPEDVDSEQDYERAMMAVGFAAVGMWDQVEKAMGPFFRDLTVRGRTILSLLKRAQGIPKWGGVGGQNSAAFSTIDKWCQWGDFVSSWIGIGIAALNNPSAYIPAMLEMETPSKGFAITYAAVKAAHPTWGDAQIFDARAHDLAAKLDADDEGRGQVVMARMAMQIAGY